MNSAMEEASRRVSELDEPRAGQSFVDCWGGYYSVVATSVDADSTEPTVTLFSEMLGGCVSMPLAAFLGDAPDRPGRKRFCRRFVPVDFGCQPSDVDTTAIHPFDPEWDFNG